MKHSPHMPHLHAGMYFSSLSGSALLCGPLLLISPPAFSSLYQAECRLCGQSTEFELHSVLRVEEENNSTKLLVLALHAGMVRGHLISL